MKTPNIRTIIKNKRRARNKLQNKIFDMQYSILDEKEKLDKACQKEKDKLDKICQKEKDKLDKICQAKKDRLDKNFQKEKDKLAKLDDEIFHLTKSTSTTNDNPNPSPCGDGLGALTLDYERSE
ncbi:MULTISPECIES: hypothetical protein [unclassified Campylobacter]|uniref:hypothetical protein n=1 Tax=unclassified Campylobacter TaxID=2593542 RepID=UPI0022E99C05|nr:MULTISPECIES: hypothetical protein [unclassified Campylobacter]MDA3047299.1 hypothetical protein [Campylobacter sp. JMF_08 NE1]MDA3054949.1 hypothetical protein [Campylobacter sp. VBCF_07 NA4]MDA3060451.1 hypothetical protein [Campylobacter sp. VBCF_02 NA5]MDA3070283.1 hypothetical protein [Campylobacter sp. VBCF_08 NA3]WBR54713.1 hypothetical protein PF027_02245 [Campylobacter sp. VBCF_01 NA2]